jgi:hypothetical protein
VLAQLQPHTLLLLLLLVLLLLLLPRWRPLQGGAGRPGGQTLEPATAAVRSCRSC